MGSSPGGRRNLKDGGESPRLFLDLEAGQRIGWPGEKVSRGRLPSRTDPCLSKKPHPPSSGGTGRGERLLPRRLWPDPPSPPSACRLGLPLRFFPSPKSLPLGFSPWIKGKGTFFGPRSTLPFKSLPSGLQPPSNSKIFSGKIPFLP